MKKRLLGATLATAWLLFVPGTAWTQARSGGHHGGGSGGRERAARGERQAQPRSAGANAPRVVTVGPSRLFFSQPYYAFQPRTHVGFGLYLGYPVAYPAIRFYSNVYPYPYSYPYPYYPYSSPLPNYSTYIPTYGSPAPSAMTVVPGGTSVPATGGTQPPAATGGVSFEITPGDAAVFVDGVYIGRADDFSAMAPPLLLAAGRHHFELRAQGYQPAAFDVDVTPGLVTPYRGTLQP